MDSEKFAMFLATVVSPAVVGILVDKLALSEKEAVRVYFSSRLYAALSDEEQKLWRYSPELLASLAIDELKTGSYTLPEEAL